MKLNKKLINKTADLIRKNFTVSDICVLCDIAPQTFYRWLKEGKEQPEGSRKLQRKFYLAVETAKIQWKNEALNFLSEFEETQTAVTETVGEDGDLKVATVVTTKKPVNRNHIKWLLSRRFKEEFGEDSENSDNDKDEPDATEFERQIYGDDDDE